MAPAARDRTGVLILRIWLEADPQHGLRARIIEIDDLANTKQRTVAAAGVEEIVEIVHAWVDRFERRGDAGVTGT